MAIDNRSPSPVDFGDLPYLSEKSPGTGLWGTIRWVLTPLASLKLTVALFVLAIILVFCGTLAQVDHDVWEVVHSYFRAPLTHPFTWIDFQIFFPRDQKVGGGFPFPGGGLIGALMFLNLLAAHAVRFKTQARGARLAGGLGVIALGVVVAWLVVESGSNRGEVDADPLVSWQTLWTFFKAGFLAVTCATVFGAFALHPSQKLKRWVLMAFAGLLVPVTAWLLYSGFSPDPSGMRILWQLTKAEVAALVLLAGCAMAFKKRAGIVLLHLGVGLMLFNEVFVGLTSVERQMKINEGETAYFSYDIRSTELAVVDRSDPVKDHVVAVPQRLLEPGDKISDARLPFNIEIEKYYKNSNLRVAKRDETDPADEGPGKFIIADEARPGAGTDTDSRVDLAAAYVKLSSKEGARPLGTFLVSQELSEDDWPAQVTVDGKKYLLYLRFKRNYPTYSVKLLDVRGDTYAGTGIAKNYSSDVVISDPSRNVEMTKHIWMNNPLRYAGETFYQSQYHVNQLTGQEVTVLQVVYNEGWMIPYVGCMIVLTGILAQFLTTLLRFLQRQPAPQPGLGGWVWPAGVVVCCAVWLIVLALPPRAKPEAMHLYDFGKLPVMYEGRIKPLDTLARAALRSLCDRQTVAKRVLVPAAKKEAEKADKKEEKSKAAEPNETKPAIAWLLDMMTGRDQGDQVIRIENPEVLDMLGLEPREGFRYSIREIPGSKLKEFDKQRAQAAEAREKKETLSVFQSKVLELNAKLGLYDLLFESYRQPGLRKGHEKEDLVSEFPRLNRLRNANAPLTIPPDHEGDEWLPYSLAWTVAFAQASFHQGKPNQDTVDFEAILEAYTKQDVAAFNKAVRAYSDRLAGRPPENYSAAKLGFEAAFNHFEPFYNTSLIYLLAFLLACLGWLLLSPDVQRISFGLILVALIVHTLAIAGRIYISGRPPVTNLYSASVFIGWGAVVLGVILEAIFRNGIGNLVAGVAGFAALLIAHFLAASGDTLIVMQAVLDTPFWLATHVTCITLGYVTTYVAGILGLAYVLLGVLTPHVTTKTSKDLTRMIYGMVCFAMVFSFFGTVLGGLWADDSWGRFWGWDPKENGALIIVLWNALVLHARWGGMVRDRGMAILAIVGNIVTSWSFFGVNQLSVGLHNYGFTDGVTRALVLFVLSQLVVIGVGLTPQTKWWSVRRAEEKEALLQA